MADEDKEAVGVSDDVLMAEVALRSKEVTGLLHMSKTKALIASLINPPILAKGAEVKVDSSKDV